MPSDVDAVVQRARFELYPENITGALDMLRGAHAAHAAPEYAALIARIEGWLGHLETREAYIAAQEEQYNRLRWRISLKFLEKQFRMLTGRKTRKLIARRARHPEFALLEAEIAATAARRVVDGGCGEGGVALALAYRHRDLHLDAVDASATNVRIARRLNRYRNVTFHEGLLEEVHRLFTPGSVDLLYSFAVLEHVRDVDETIRSILTAVRPGGRVCFVVPMREFTVDGPLPEYTPIHGYIDHVRVFSERELRQRFGGCDGFTLHKLPATFEPEEFERSLVPVEFGSFFFAFSRPS